MLEAAVPVLGHVGHIAGEHVDHLLDVVAVDDPAQASPVGVLARDHHGHVVMEDLDRQVVPLLAEEVPALLLQHHASSVVRIHDVVALAEVALDGGEPVLDIRCFLDC